MTPEREAKLSTITDMGMEIERLRAEVKALRAALAASQARVASAGEALTTVKRLWAKATRSIGDLRSERDKLRAEVEQLREEVTSCGETIVVLNVKIGKQQAKIDRLRYASQEAELDDENECLADHDVVAALQELINTMPLPGRAVGFMSDAVAELIHLRWQRDRLQKRGSELVKERQAAQSSVDRKLKDLAAEELHEEIRWLTERALMAERVAFKLSEYFDQYDSPGEFLTEPECYVLESIDYRQGLLGPPGDTSCKEPTCTRKHYVHTKECGCLWDHVTNSWSGCETHASSEWSPVVGGSKSGSNE
jgi:hypothetical protein